MFVSYDLKGIQSFIFRIPKLRYIVGGSALIDAFDREWAPQQTAHGIELLFAGGGRGVFLASSPQDAAKIKQNIINKAHAVGADVAIGIHEDFSMAVHSADHLYPYLPQDAEMDGHPCPESGLYPSASGKVHPIVAKRVDPKLRFHIEEEMLQKLRSKIADPELQKLRFFHDVSPDGDFGDADARDAAFSMGSRNRWAIVVMDGNDMGSQFRVQEQKIAKSNPEKYRIWLKNVSRTVDETVREACAHALVEVVNAWWTSDSIREAQQKHRKLFLPLRPLVVGGDDIIILCHVSYAFLFVKEVCAFFARESRARNDAWKKQHGHDLWPATGGELSISAGVLFSSVTLPLATAVPYAESLLASAKNKGRQHPEGQPAPACIDWEQVTESVLDHPALRRKRDFRFLDQDINNTVIELTRRPYTLQEFNELETLAQSYAGIPGTIRHQVLPALRAGFFDRQVWLARLGKRRKSLGNLVSDLKENLTNNEHKAAGRWKTGQKGEISTDVVDALLLLEEQERMSRPTVEEVEA